MNGGVEIAEDIAALLAAGMDDGLQIRGELVAAGALCTTAGPAPANETAKLALGVVVRGLDARVGDEAPQRIAVLEDVAAGALKALDGQTCALVE